ncbi:unnamed protein product [Ilex paraguariensis]|uniref:Uncharacterized protein n=1 Tax=Ilex paraguariensis TaxID=185542 RepID=A0ABC8S223_9AQUA
MAEKGKLHIVMFPWLAFGHMIPYLELAKLIAQKGHKISLVSTPRNIDRLPKLPPNLTPSIDFVKLPLPHVGNLPENAEATIDVPFDKVKYLKIAYDGLKEPITHFLKTSSPDWVFYDFVPFWLGSIAAELNISRAFFSIFTAPLLSFFGPVPVLKGTQEDRTKLEDFTVRPKWVPFETTVVFRLFEIKRVFNSFTGDDDDVPDTYRAGAGIEDCEVLVVRGCSEFEPEWLKLLEEIHGKPVIPVGQLPTTVFDGGDDDTDDAWRGMKEWLDKQVKGSVVYVAFGSEAKPSQAELTRLLLGWSYPDTELIDLPEGFEERTKDRGWVCTSWAPQLKILSHDSVGGFLTHSGWSSVVEAIQFERALILLTFLADQGLNARVLEEKKMAYSIPRNETDGSFTRNTVAESLSLVMVGEEGKVYREKVKEMRELFVGRDRQDGYVDNLLGYLRSHRRLKLEDQSNGGQRN